jgi:cytochrome P450
MIVTGDQVPIQELPKLPGVPLAGSALALRRDLLGTFDRAAELGDIVRMDFGEGPIRTMVVFYFGPHGVHEVLTSRDQRLGKSSPYWAEMTRWLGHGLLTSDGARWARQRRTVSQLFAHSQLKQWRTVMEQEAERVADEMVALAPTTISLSPPAVRIALRVISRTVLGTQDVGALSALHHGVGLASQQIVRRANSLVRPPFWFPTPRQFRARRGFGKAFAVADALIATRRQQPGDDLISLLLRAHDESGRPLATEDVREQAVLFLFAGHETTAIGLATALHQLASRPDLQDAVTTDLDVSRRVFLEGLRLWPPAYMTGRAVRKEMVLAGVRLPAGTAVTVSPWVTHRRSELWVEPERFDPNRFTADHVKIRPKGAYFPFGLGPQSCIGDRFATLEATLAISAICRKLRLSKPSGPLRRDLGLTMRPVGLTARIERRRG